MVPVYALEVPGIGLDGHAAIVCVGGNTRGRGAQGGCPGGHGRAVHGEGRQVGR